MINILYALLIVFSGLNVTCSTPLSANPQVEVSQREVFFHQASFQNFTGRIIRQFGEDYVKPLTFHPVRRITFLFGKDGFEKLEGKNGYEMLKVIGYSHLFIENIVRQGYSFKIIAFSDNLETK